MGFGPSQMATVRVEVLDSLARGAHGGRIRWNNYTSYRFTEASGLEMGLWTGVEWTVVEPTVDTIMFNTTDLDTDGNPLVADMLYDVFAEYTGSSTSFDMVLKKWSSVGTGGDSARQAQLHLFDGAWVEADTPTGHKRRHIGTIYTDDAGGGAAKFMYHAGWTWNRFNRILRGIARWRNMTSGSWTYSTAAWRELNGGTNQERAIVITGSTNLYSDSDYCEVSNTFDNLGTGNQGAYGVTINYTGDEYGWVDVEIPMNLASGNRAPARIFDTWGLFPGYNYVTGNEYGHASGFSTYGDGWTFGRVFMRL